ncbi:MAG: hypothetical protein ACLQVW_09695, partial [Limisphaerales bacterium]
HHNAVHDARKIFQNVEILFAPLSVRLTHSREYFFAQRRRGAEKVGKKSKEELHKLLSMKPLCPFSAGLYFFWQPSLTFTDLH